VATYYKQQLWTESVSAVTATPSVALGTRRIVNGSEYCYCYNGTTEASVKSLVQLEHGGSEYTFTVTTTVDPFVKPFGVVENNTFAAADYGWILTRGYTDLCYGGTVTAPVAFALYPNLYAGADGVVDPATGGTGTTGIGALVGRAMEETATTGGSFLAYVNLG